MPPSDEMNVRQAAQALGVHENTIRKWVGDGTITPSRTLPGSGFKRFSRADVERIRREMFAQFAPDTVVGEEQDDMPVAPEAQAEQTAKEAT